MAIQGAGRVTGAKVPKTYSSVVRGNKPILASRSDRAVGHGCDDRRHAAQMGFSVRRVVTPGRRYGVHFEQRGFVFREVRFQIPKANRLVLARRNKAATIGG